MAAAELGQVLSLVGLFLMVLSGLGGRRRRVPGSRAAAWRRWQRGGQLAGFVLILVGLLLMGAQK